MCDFHLLDRRRQRACRHRIQKSVKSLFLNKPKERVRCHIIEKLRNIVWKKSDLELVQCQIDVFPFVNCNAVEISATVHIFMTANPFEVKKTNRSLIFLLEQRKFFIWILYRGRITLNLCPYEWVWVDALFWQYCFSKKKYFLRKTNKI